MKVPCPHCKKPIEIYVHHDESYLHNVKVELKKPTKEVLGGEKEAPAK